MGWAASSRSRPRSDVRSPAWSSWPSEVPGELRLPAHQHELREIPELFGKSLIGWETLPERLQRDHRDLTIADILRIQHLMGQKPHESGRARRAIRRGIRVDRSAFDGVPRMVIGAGLDRQVPIEIGRAAGRVA